MANQSVKRTGDTISESAKLLQPGFSTADAKYPDIALSNGVLRVVFTDWREKRIVVEFANVAGVRWQETESHGPEERNDSVYEIVGSDWLTELLVRGAREHQEGHRHFKLCFNAYGPLEVLATEMRLASAGTV